MLGEPHDLLHDFPQFAARIEELKASDPSFARLVREHDELDADIRRLEELGQPVADITMETLKLHRVHLKDRLYRALTG
jgi:uncharacterized protein YdcH (DUF465 family)